MKLWPRFSVRTLLILVSLIGLYFGCWELTKRWGMQDAPELPQWTYVDFGARGRYPIHSWFDSSPAPFLISRERILDQHPYLCREYHFWFLGYQRKLFQREVGALRLVDSNSVYPQ